MTSPAGREPEEWSYRDGDLQLVGEIWRPEGNSNGRAVLVLHEADGIGGNVRRHCGFLRDLGYTAFAADLHGGGRVLEADEIPPALNAFLSDRTKLQKRAGAAVASMIERHGWSGRDIAAIGYCFGGTAALELARVGTPIAAVASFHGLLTSTAPLSHDLERPRILVCTGARDSLVPTADVAAFQEEMRAADADWELAVFGRAMHSFTNRDVDGLGDDRMAFDPGAEADSWALLLSFLDRSLESGRDAAE